MSPKAARETVARLLVVAGVVLLGAPACAAEGRPSIELGPAVAAEPSGGVTQVVLEMANVGDAADRLVAVDTESAVGVEIHRSDGDDVTDMQPIGDVAIGPGERVRFEQRGLHLMVIAPRSDVRPGASFDLVLEFERSGTRTAEVAVLDQTELRRWLLDVESQARPR